MPLTVGLIGCGFISHVYLRTCAAYGVPVVACADLDAQRAGEVAREHEIPRHLPVHELLANEQIDIVLNLTPPLAHTEVTLRALGAGKHVYTEKPLALTREDGKRIMETAASHGLRVGCAPDTFMSNGVTAAWQQIDAGAIGRPVAAAATFMSRGNEMWHPDPEFFYRPGGGPLFDMGPYYLSALATLLGSVRQVIAMNSTAFPQRTITSKPRAGETLEVDVPTHWTAALTFVSGVTASLTASWDVWWHTHPHVEIYGSEGTLQLPNPGYYVKPALFRSREGDAWVEVAPESGLEVKSRGIGLVDMARAIETGTPHRASVELAYHVLDVMCSMEESAESGCHVEVRSAFL